MKEANTNAWNDELWNEAICEILRCQRASTTMLQRHFHIGYVRASRLINAMEHRGIISGKCGYEARKIIMDEAEVRSKYL